MSDSDWRGGGQGVVGYALVIALFVVGVIAIINLIGTSIADALRNFVDALPLPRL